MENWLCGAKTGDPQVSALVCRLGGGVDLRFRRRNPVLSLSQKNDLKNLKKKSLFRFGTSDDN